MAKNLCPFDWEHGPCREHDCALFIQTEWQNDRGEVRTDWSCVFVAQLRLQFGTNIEQQRVQAGLDKVANQVAGGFGGLLALAGESRQAIRDGK